MEALWWAWLELALELKRAGALWVVALVSRTMSTDHPQELTRMTTEVRLRKLTSPSRTCFYSHSSQQLTHRLIPALLKVGTMFQFVHPSKQFLDDEHSVCADRGVVATSLLQELELQRAEIK